MYISVIVVGPAPWSILMALWMVLIAVSAKEDIVQRINYGVIFHKASELDISQQYWHHSFQVIIPELGFNDVEQLRCTDIQYGVENVQLCNDVKNMFGQINKMRMEIKEKLNFTMSSIDSFHFRVILRQLVNHVGMPGRPSCRL